MCRGTPLQAFLSRLATAIRYPSRSVARAFVTRSVQPGQVFVPMHYAETNRLTDAVFDPYSKQPSYKACAVNLSLIPSPGPVLFES